MELTGAPHASNRENTSIQMGGALFSPPSTLSSGPFPGDPVIDISILDRPVARPRRAHQTVIGLLALASSVSQQLPAVDRHNHPGDIPCGGTYQIANQFGDFNWL